MTLMIINPGLKASGYATNPKYAILIINLIEKYDLNQFTLLASNTAVLPNAVALVNNTATNNAQLATYSYKSNSNPTSNQPAPHSKLKSNAIEGDNEAENNDQDNPSINVPFYTPTSLNGLKGFYGKKGDMLLDYATKSNIRYTKLLALNGLPDAPLEADMFVYTEKKLKKGLQEKYTVLAGETLIQISQKTGVELQQLKLLNKLIEGVEVKSGEIINLQFDRNYSPEVYIPQTEKASKSSNNNKKKEDDNYIVNTNKKQNTQKDAEHYTFPNASKATSNKDDKQTINNKQTESRYGNKETIIAAKNTPEIKNEKKSEQLVPDKNEQNQIDNKPATTNYNNLTPYEKLKLHMEKNGSAQEEFKGPSTKHELITINTKAEENNNTYISVAPTSAKSQTNKPVNNTAKVSATTKTHKVKKGDTLFSIAHKYNVSVKQLQDWNKVTPKTLTVGKTIKVSK
jgi:LysM repeat protein